MGGLKLHIHRQTSFGIRSNAYLVYDSSSCECLVVDPGCFPEKIMDKISNLGLKLKYIVLTHAHFDHIAGAADLKALSGAKICMHRLDHELAFAPEKNAAHVIPGAFVKAFSPDCFLKEPDRLYLGKSYLSVIETPGHTPGGISLYTPGYLICGDLILKGGTGRMDLYGANIPQISQIIREKVYSLPKDTIICCGHGETSTVEYEQLNNKIKPFSERSPQ